MGSQGELVVRESPEELWAALASLWGEVAREAVRRRGYFTAALSGGRTPEVFYRFLAAESGPWDRTHLFQADERLVPAGDPRSNARLIEASLLARLPGRTGSVHFVDTSLAGAAADAYEEELREFFATRQEGLPSFDLVLLGLGADGHTASLFPGSEALDEEERLVAAVPAAGARVARVTLTLAAVNHARAVAFLVTGAEKREALAGVLPGGDRDAPAARVRPREGKLVFFADRAAAPTG